MDSILRNRWRAISSLHRYYIRSIVPILLLALSVTEAKADEVSSSWQNVEFNGDIRYSQWVINSRIRDFYGNTIKRGFNTYDASGKEISKAAGEQDFDYVPGLVAKAILEAYANYSTFDWSKPWFYSVMNYAKDKSYTTKTADKGITLDNMNACKMYFPLMAEGVLDKSAASNGTSTITAVIDDMKTYNTNYVIGNATNSGVASSTNETVKSMFGGWFHKPAYKDQMWCDGLYMGAALLAQIVNYKNSTKNVDATNDWDLITKQFTISWTQLYNSEKGLLYHAFTANPKDNASTAWSGISNTEGSEVYHSAAFWGRAMGWYFLALVDVLEQMEEAGLNSSTNDKYSCYTTLKDYLDKLAAGLAKYQDGTSGCWYQVIDEIDTHLDGNYLESSCTSLFAAAYLKAVNLKLLSTSSNGTYNYKTIGENAFKGAVAQFMKCDTYSPGAATTVQLVHNCASAGLGGNDNRSGSREYYISGPDVGQTNNYTEGKVMGAFIMAATEYEKANAKAIRFSYDLAPSYTLTQGEAITAEALGSGDISYKWYNASNDSEVSGATSATFAPTTSGSYYCKATSGTTTIQTSTANVTLTEAVVSVDIFSLTVTYNQVYDLASDQDLDLTSDYASVTGGTALVHNGKIQSAKIIESGNINLNGSGGSYAKLTLNTPLQIGDVITFTSDDNSIGSFYLTSSDTKNENCPVTSGTYTITATDELAAAKNIYVWKITNGKFKSITITRAVSITTQPTGETYDVNAANVNELKFEVSATGVKEFSYQWYKNTTNSNVGGQLIDGAEEASYKPDVTTAGTTYYYCIASAGGLSVTSNVVAVSVLNPSDLNTKYNAAWTPIANGTIEVGNLVTSSSKGAYSITTENDDVATISGTTITALKAGTFTLSQEADDKYKAGSIDITVRIGTNVTSDGTNEYSFTAQTTDVSDNMTIARKDITMTFGNDGFWSQASADSYTGGKVNPTVPANNIPTAGTFYKFTPTTTGTLAVKVKLNTDGGKLRPLYVSENGTLITAILENSTEVGKGETPAAAEAYNNKSVTFPVKANTDYYVYVTGSKLGFYGFEFTPATVYTVTFNAGSNGTCSTTSLTQASEGASITLPEATPNTGYTFDGWYTEATGGTKEGDAGATYIPTADNITLYAKWTPITDLFSLTSVTLTDKTVASNTPYDVTSEDAIVTGGSVQLYNGHSDPRIMIYRSQINLNGSGGSYMKITLDNTLKAGDEIIINPSSSSFKLSKTNSTSNSISFTGSYVIQTGDAVDDQNVIYIYKDSNSLIEDISISRYYPESDSRATFTYDEKTLTFSEKTAGDKSTYTTTLEIGAHKKGKNITITPSVKDGASIKQCETVVSGGITITVPSTIGQTTTSTYTVTSKDKTSTTTYEIIVKLVKDNVVLVYSNGSTEWTWDKTVNPTKPEFTQPTLTAYLANEDGTASSTEVTIKTNIKYLSDEKDVATVDEENGTITIKDDANGGAKIYAILEGHSHYNDAQTFFNILVKQGYSYSVADDETIKNGPSLNQPVYIKKVETNGETNVETNLVKMTFGGWKWNTFKDDKDNYKVKSTYVVNGSTRKDEWNAATTSKESEIASIDGYKTSISGATDAVDESKKESDGVIYGSKRYGWFKPAEERDDGYLETYPYSLPVRGAYMTFEPTQNGTLTVYILQNGAWNTNRSGEYQGINFNDGEIVAGEFRPHSFYICNQRGLNVDQFSPNTFTCTTKQKVQGKYYCDRTTQDKQNDPYNIATWTEFDGYMSEKEQERVEANWSSGINGAQKIVRLDNGSYLAIQKGIVKYTFFVTANETYYLFSNFSKLGFCGANFVPSETVVPENDEAHKMTLSDETAYPTIEKPVPSATGEDQYKYKFGGTVKGYVKDFTIPLFKSITLNRTFKKDQWTTLSLPFNLTQTEVEEIFGKGTEILVFKDAITDGTKLHVKFFYHEIQNILPGYPYLIRPTLVDANGTAMTTKVTSTDNAPTYTIGDNGNLTIFTVYDKAINPNIELHEFQATTDKNYTAKVTPEYCTNNTVTFDGKDHPYSTKYDTGDLFISDSDGKLYESAGDSYGKGYRSFIDYTGTSSASKSLTISFSGVEDSDDNGGTTEIKVAELDNGIRQALGFVGVYNLNGQKVAETTHNLPAGIYIVNGRKLVVK